MKHLDLATTLCWGIGSCLIFLGLHQWLVEKQEGGHRGFAVFGKISVLEREVYLRPEKGSLWQGVFAKGEVYSNDVLKTGDSSRVVIESDTGARIDVAENSLLRLEMTGESPELNLVLGGLSLEGKMLLSAGSQTVSVDGSVTVDRIEEAKALQLQTLSGNVEVRDEKGRVQSVNEGSTITLGDAGSLQVESYPIKRHLPNDMSTLVLTEPYSLADFQIEFKEPVEGEQLLLEISMEESFKDSSEYLLGKSLGRVDLGHLEGRVFWRVKSADSSKVLSNRGSFTLIKAHDFAWKSDESDRFLEVSDEGADTRLDWTELKGVSHYQVALLMDGVPILKKTKVKTPYLRLNEKDGPFLETLKDALNSNATLLIEVKAFDQEREVAKLQSELGVLDARAPAAPSLKNASFSREHPEKLIVAWERVPAASSYELEVLGKTIKTKDSQGAIELNPADIERVDQIALRGVRKDKKGEWRRFKVNRHKLKRQKALMTELRPLYPLQETRFTQRNSHAQLEWEADLSHRGFVDHYLVRVFQEDEMLFEKKVGSPRLKLPSKLEEGRYLWQVSPHVKEVGYGRETELREFRIVEGAKMRAPAWRDDSAREF